MWIFTNIGFFSVVRHKSDASKLLVRGRVLEDMKNLVRGYGDILGLSEQDIAYTPDADYHYRVSVKTIAWKETIAMLTTSINYTNFKDSVNDIQGKDRAKAYLRVWEEMVEVQRREAQLQYLNK